MEASALSEGESGGVPARTILNFEPQVRCFGPVLQPTNKMRQFATSGSLECTAERHVTYLMIARVYRPPMGMVVSEPDPLHG